MVQYMQAHATLIKFGYPQRVIAEFTYWLVLLRPRQITLGSLVLVARCDALSFSALEEQAFAELASVTKHLEHTLKSLFNYDKINYLMLMMQDPHVHFHVLPRYAAPREFCGMTYEDADWGKPPILTGDLTLSEVASKQLLVDIKAAWHQQHTYDPVGIQGKP